MQRPRLTKVLAEQVAIKRPHFSFRVAECKVATPLVATQSTPLKRAKFLTFNQSTGDLIALERDVREGRQEHMPLLILKVFLDHLTFRDNWFPI